MVTWSLSSETCHRPKMCQGIKGDGVVHVPCDPSNMAGKITWKITELKALMRFFVGDSMQQRNQNLEGFRRTTMRGAFTVMTVANQWVAAFVPSAVSNFGTPGLEQPKTISSGIDSTLEISWPSIILQQVIPSYRHTAIPNSLDWPLE